MELLDKSKDELLAYAKKLKMKVAANISVDNLREAVETEAIRQTVELEETVRLKLQAEAKMRIDIADIKAEASIQGITIKIPVDPTLLEVVKLKKKLNLSSKEPKPSPETLAIEASRKVYARFLNLEQEDMDVAFNVGGKYHFHLWPDKIHVIPEWLIGHLRKVAIRPFYEKRTVKSLETAKIEDVVEKIVRVKSKPRFTFEILGEVPKDDDVPFGIVLDEEIIKSLTETV